MNSLKKVFLGILFLGGILNVFSVYASKPVWTMEPAPGSHPTQTIPANGIATIDYIVRNQSNKAHQLRILPIPGITQTAPCNLAPKNKVGSSCTLHLSILVSLLGDEGVQGGPTLCQIDSNGNPSPNPNQCYHPAKGNELNLTKGAAASFFIGGSITGLTANGLILQNNGVDNLPVASGATTFEFPYTVAYGSNYNVTIAQQPTGLICSVSSGFGTNVTADVNSVIITCNIKAYTIGGTITGLTVSGLVLQNNGVEQTPAPNGATSFTFQTPVVEGGNYNVTVFQQPNGRVCNVSNGSGTNVTQNITSVMVDCIAPIYTSYIVNPFAPPNIISYCALDNSNALSNCQTFTDPSFTNITDVVINQPASVAYVLNSNAAANDISVCAVNPTGSLSGPCTTKDIGAAVTYGGLNTDNNVLYLSNYNDKRIYVCQLNPNGTIITPCIQQFTDPNITSPNGRTAFVAGGKFLYVPNFSGSSDIAICPINSNGTLAACTGFSNANFGNSLGSALNADGTYLYVTNSNSTVTICAANPLTGTLSSCTASNGFGTFHFGNAENNLFIDGDGFGYMPNDTNNTISICSIGVNGNFTACKVSVAPNGLNVSTLNSPRSVWIRTVP